MQKILHRTTVAIPEDLLAGVDRLVRNGTTANRNQFIVRAVEAELRRQERASLDAEFALMASDSAYQVDCRDLMGEFDSADRESWGMLAKADE